MVGVYPGATKPDRLKFAQFFDRLKKGCKRRIYVRK